jgi:hypothetical protein
MDRIGNARHGVALPFNYWTQQQWFQTFDALNLKIGAWKSKLGLYPRPLNGIFGRSLHFVARLDREPHRKRIPDRFLSHQGESL